MKRRAQIFFALMLSGFMIMSACGAEAGTNNTNDTEQTTEESQNDSDTADVSDVQADDEAALPSDTSEPASSTDDTAIPEKDAAGLSQEAETQVSGEMHSISCIITDASADFISFQTPEGDNYTLSIPDTGVTGNLSAVTIGQIINLTYMGSLDESHAILTDISSSSMVTGVYTEEYAFAIKIINEVRNMSISGLRELINFPLFIDTGAYAGPMNDDVFRNINSEQVFTEELVERIANYNLFDLQFTRAGFVMGEGGPNITFSVDEDGILGIIGINCTKIPTAAVSANSSGSTK